MRYTLLWDAQVLEDLKLFDRKSARKLVEKISSYLIQDPFHLGKSLSGNLRGLMRYRIGDYRVIYCIDGSTVSILKIAHRKEVYEKS